MNFLQNGTTNTQNALVRAEQFLNAGNASEALTLLLPLLTLQPPIRDSFAALRDLLIGRCYLELQQPANALEPLARAFRQQKSNANIRIAYGAALHLTKNLPEAEKHYREAIRLAPSAENPPFNLARVLVDKGDLDGATRAYQLAISRNPRYATAMAALADILIVRGELHQAQEQILKALAIEPKLALAWNAFGKLTERTGNYEVAASHYQKAVENDSNFAEGWYNLARMKSHQNDSAAALSCFERASLLDPSNEQYQFMHGILGSGDAMRTESGEARIPDRHVEHMFDLYAETFDESLVKGLSYQTPEQLFSQILPALNLNSSGENHMKLSALDLGCGTGLFGVQIAPFCSTLVGVDLSAKMLEKAKSRGYTKLVVAEIGSYLAAEDERSYNLIVASDVFIYIGDLAKIFAESKRILKSGGIFAFSVESLEALPHLDASQPFKLLPTGRYTHNSTYINSLALQYGFALRSSTAAVIRTEVRKPIMGTLFVFEVSE